MKFLIVEPTPLPICISLGPNFWLRNWTTRLAILHITKLYFISSFEVFNIKTECWYMLYCRVYPWYSYREWYKCIYSGINIYYTLWHSLQRLHPISRRVFDSRMQSDTGEFSRLATCHSDLINYNVEFEFKRGRLLSFSLLLHYMRDLKVTWWVKSRICPTRCQLTCIDSLLYYSTPLPEW